MFFFGKKNLNVEEREANRILSVIARKIITINQKSVKSPTINQWKSKSKQVYVMVKNDSFPLLNI